MGRGFPGQLLVLISVVTFLFDRLIAFDLCNCARKHPQTMFCEADFVIQVLRRNTRTFVSQRYRTVASQDPWQNPHTSQFYVRIKRIYKGDGYFLNTRSVKLHTPTSPSCSASIEPNLPYIVTGTFRGGSPTISICTWVTPMIELEKRFRKILRKGRFMQQCNRCSIHPCYGHYCFKRDNSCAINYSSIGYKCYMKHTYCRMNAWGRCEWANSRHKLQACIAQERRNEFYNSRKYPSRK